MLNIIKSIKSNLRASATVNSSLIKLRSIISDEYQLEAEMMEAFLVLNTQDKVLAKALDQAIHSAEETEIHQVIAALSYAIPMYGIETQVGAYYTDKCKIALASIIVKEYHTVCGAREDQKIRTINGRKVATDLHYLQARDYKAVEKNMLNGVHFTSGEMPTKHIKTKPGAPRLKVCKKLKEVAKAVSSMKLRVVSDINQAQLLDVLLAGDDYLEALAGNGSEHRIAMRARFSRYVELTAIIHARSQLDGMYLSVNFCYRNRMYYDVSLQTLNPQSKIGKYMLEAFDARTLTELDYKNLAFAAASSVARCKLEDGVATFEANELAISIKLLGESDVLTRTYNKRLLKAINDYKKGIESRFLLLLDYTTGGLIHFSSGYTQEKQAMTLANILASEPMQDTHQTMLEKIADITGQTMSRKDAKVINQSILAGASAESATKKFNEHFGEELLTVAQLNTIGTAVYGQTYKAFNQYNTWGKNLLDNDNSSLMFTMSDGVKCMSSAYIQGQEVKVYVPTTQGMKQMTIHRNMPLLIDNKSGTPLLVGAVAQAKVSGFLANTTHAVDGKAIRKIVLAMAKINAVGIFIHDNIGTSGEAQETVREAAKADIQENFDDQVFLDIQHQVTNNRVGSLITVRDYSVCDMEVLELSNSFLQA